MSQEMIYAEDLSKTFGSFSAVDGVNLQVSAGEVLAILGPNGAGKTTTVRMLTTTIKPTKGLARVAGFDVISQPDEVRARVGILHEHHGLYNRMTAQEYLHFFGELYGLRKSVRRERITELLERFGLDQAGNKRLGDYSKGMRQKVALVRTLLHHPPVLILDEPTSAMDPESVRVVRDAVCGLRSNDRAIVLCTHNLVEAEELADKIAIMRQGKIILQGTPDELKNQVLGCPEFELRLASQFNPSALELPPEVMLMGSGPGWIRFQVREPEKTNPSFIRQLVDYPLQVISFQEVPRSLEEVYIHVARQIRQEEIHVE